MCVIAFVQTDEQRLTAEQVEKMWAANAFGAGYSHREEAPDGAIHVRWKKGLTEEEVVELAQTLPLPHIIHFRNPSNGTSHDPEACHPFPLEIDVPMVLGGLSKEGVLFHNGFWTGWKEKVIDWSLRGGFILPSGGWSDSRGLAFIAANLGHGILDLIDEKVIIMTPTRIESFGNGWTKMDGGLLVSNLAWQNPPKTQHQGSHYTTPPASMAGGTTFKGVTGGTKWKAGGPSQQGTFCRVPGFTGNSALPLRPALAGSSLQDAVQETYQAVVSPGALSAEDRAAKEWAVSVAKGTLCEDCEKVPGNVLHLNVRRCHACWDAHQRKMATGSATGTCEFCGKLPTTFITTKEAKWICNSCWRAHDQPEVVRDEDLRPHQAQALQAKRAGGSL